MISAGRNHLMPPIRDKICYFPRLLSWKWKLIRLELKNYLFAVIRPILLQITRLYFPIFVNTTKTCSSNWQVPLKKSRNLTFRAKNMGQLGKIFSPDQSTLLFYLWSANGKPIFFKFSLIHKKQHQRFRIILNCI